MTWTLDAALPTLDSGTGSATLDGGPTSSVIFGWMPSIGAKKQTKFKVRRAEFGDGYAQRSGVGINNAGREWPLVFDRRSEAEIVAIEDFLDSRDGAQSFLWIPPFANPGDDAIRVTCEEYETTVIDGGLSLSATFKRAYGE